MVLFRNEQVVSAVISKSSALYVLLSFCCLSVMLHGIHLTEIWFSILYPGRLLSTSRRMPQSHRQGCPKTGRAQSQTGGRTFLRRLLFRIHFAWCVRQRLHHDWRSRFPRRTRFPKSSRVPQNPQCGHEGGLLLLWMLPDCGVTVFMYGLLSFRKCFWLLLM